MDQFKFHGDPRTQEGWEDGPCEKQDILRFMNRYEAKDEIKCNIIRCGTPHKNGYTALTHEGVLKLVGKDCGRKLLGNEAFNRLTNRLANEERIAGIRRRIDNDAFDPGKALEGLRLWAPTIETVAKSQRAIRDVSGRLWQILSERALSHDGNLVVEEKVRNWAAEEIRSSKGQDGSPMYQFQNRHFHRMAGLEFFHTFDATHHLRNDLETLEAIVRDLSAEASRKIKDARLVEIVSEAERVAHHMERMADVVEGTRAFVKPENLSKIAEWINLQRGVGITAAIAGTALVLGGETIRLPSPDPCDRTYIGFLRTKSR